MRKIFVVGAIAFLIAIFAGCTKQPQVSSSNQPSPAIDSSSETESSAETNQIGKTFNEIKQENPDVEYQAIGIPDADGLCLGTLSGKFSYYFYGTQEDIPSFKSISIKHGDDFRCAGIATTVGELYPQVTDQMPLEQFFETIGVTEYTYDGEVGPGMGWIDFMHDDLHIWIRAIDGELNEGEFKKVTTMKRSYTVVAINEKIETDNMSIQQREVEEQFK